jgi:ectoine hydroxylase-related dioxygenase (phytanoyl-CoA dioxygenase family)
MATRFQGEDRPESEIDGYVAHLLEHGYVIVPRAEDPSVMRAVDADLAEPFARTPFSRGNFSGERTVRFGRALVRSSHAGTVIQNRLVCRIADRILLPFCERIQLNLTQGIAVHPGAPAQLPHRDQDMWGGPKGDMEYMVNVVWPLSRFTRENGATLVWKGSHREDKDKYVVDDAVIAAVMNPGDALIFLGSTLHGQGANQSDEIRRTLVVGYSLSWLKPYENAMLSYPPDVARHFPRELAELVGYAQLSANLNNFEGQSPTILFEDDLPEHFGVVDCFRPEQVEAIDYFFEHRKPRLV